VLGAFQEIEDNLAALRILEEESRVQANAVQAARTSVTLTMDRYEAGTVSYIDVVTTQAAELANERSAVDVFGRRMTASVALIKALGGGFEAGDLPSAAALAEAAP
jgi:outer membrane protein TolC